MENNCPINSFDTIDAHHNIYYCYKCKKYHVCSESKQLLKAIEFLQVDRVKEIINNMTKDELINYRCYDLNIMNFILLSQIFKNKSVSIQLFNFFDGMQKYNSKEQQEAMELYMEILDFICSKVSELITEDMIIWKSDQRANSIVKILTNYYIDMSSECCVICYSSHRSKLIDNTCSCKNKIHLECLIEVTKKLGNICKTCNSNNSGIIEPNGRILFPSKNIYMSPLGCNYIIVNNKKSQLHFACAYLQYKTVSELLNDFTKEEYINYYNTADYYALHSHNKQTKALIIKDMPYTNLSRSKNMEAFDETEKVLSVFHEKIMD